MKIDFVVTWVDGSDPKWLRKKNKYSPSDEIMNTDIRYRDYGTFKYWFRAIEENAPWVNKVYLVTEGHYPEWLNLNNEKLCLVKHSDFMSERYLPTFNSNAIELNVHKIKGLSEHFVLFNDDVFLMNKTSPGDFFRKGLPRDFAIYNPTIPSTDFSNILFNDVRIINKHFNKMEDIKNNFFKVFNIFYGAKILRNIVTLPWPKILGYWNSHLTSSFLKSTFEEVWDKEKDILEETSRNKFRTPNDVNQWLMRYFQIEEGHFEPQNSNFGKIYTLNQFDELKTVMNNDKYKVLCINDDFDVQNYEQKMEELINMFEKVFPNKSSYEI